MEQERIEGAWLKKMRTAAGKFKYAAAVILLGMFLMLLPHTGTRTDGKQKEFSPSDGPAAVQQEMQAMLAALDGVGELRLMLTADAQKGGWTGAVVICEGADSAAVRLRLTEAISALTGLSYNQITIGKGRPQP